MLPLLSSESVSLFYHNAIILFHTAHVNVDTRARTRMHTHAHACTRTHTHTHTPTSAGVSQPSVDRPCSRNKSHCSPHENQQGFHMVGRATKAALWFLAPQGDGIKKGPRLWDNRGPCVPPRPTVVSKVKGPLEAR